MSDSSLLAGLDTLLFCASLFKNTENREFFTAIFLRGVKQNTLTGEKVSGIISIVGSVKALTFTQRADRRMSVLLDYYGQMLTEKQLEVAQLYYNEDLSLAEIAQFANITRQGVRDSIKRAEATLLEMEERMGLARKFRDYQEKIDQITDCAKEIAFEAEKYALGKRIGKEAGKILELAQEMNDETISTVNGGNTDGI